MKMNLNEFGRERYLVVEMSLKHSISLLDKPTYIHLKLFVLECNFFKQI